MKKFLFLGICSLIIIAIPIVNIMYLFTPSGEEVIATTYCMLDETKMEDALTETEKEVIESLSEDDQIVEIIFLAKYEPNNLTIQESVEEVHKINRVAKEKEFSLTRSMIIQTYAYGIEFIDFLESNLVSEITIEINEKYEDSLETELEETKTSFYTDVQSFNYSNFCVQGASGTPVERPYVISGWFPSYNQDGTGGYHDGIDFAIPIGTPLFSVAEAEVVLTSSQCLNNGSMANSCGGEGDNGLPGISGLGNFVILKVKDQDIFLAYAHLTAPLVKIGDTVSVNQQIGISGHSGRSTGPHLHFVVAQSTNMYDVVNSRKVIDPCGYLPGVCDQ